MYVNGSHSELVVSSLGSGSNGNSFLIEHGQTRVLVDAGVPIRTLLACLTLRGIRPMDLTAVLLSHEHSDHVRSLAQLLRRVPLPVLATRGTHAGIIDAVPRDQHVIRSLEPSTLGHLTVTPIPVNHDAREPVGFFVESPVASVAIMSDLGEANETNAEFASKSDHLIIESNYDEGMLRTGRYPAYLKSRIRSSDGHLGNHDCADFLKATIRDRTSEIWLCHLSENNNTPALALQETETSLKSAGIFRSVSALPRYDGSIVTWRSSQRRPTINQSSFLP